MDDLFEKLKAESPVNNKLSPSPRKKLKKCSEPDLAISSSTAAKRFSPERDGDGDGDGGGDGGGASPAQREHTPESAVRSRKSGDLNKQLPSSAALEALNDAQKRSPSKNADGEERKSSARVADKQQKTSPRNEGGGDQKASPKKYCEIQPKATAKKEADTVPTASPRKSAEKPSTLSPKKVAGSPQEAPAQKDAGNVAKGTARRAADSQSTASPKKVAGSPQEAPAQKDAGNLAKGTPRRAADSQSTVSPKKDAGSPQEAPAQKDAGNVAKGTARRAADSQSTLSPKKDAGSPKKASPKKIATNEQKTDEICGSEKTSPKIVTTSKQDDNRQNLNHRGRRSLQNSFDNEDSLVAHSDEKPKEDTPSTAEREREREQKKSPRQQKESPTKPDEANDAKSLQTLPTKAQKKLFDPTVLPQVEKHQSEPKIRHCMVRLQRVNFKKLQGQVVVSKQKSTKRHSLNADSEPKGGRKRKSTTAHSTSLPEKRIRPSPKQNRPVLVKLNVDKAVGGVAIAEVTIPKKRGRPRKQPLSEVKAAKLTNDWSLKTAAKQAKSNKFTRTDLVKQFGKRFLSCYVKMERCSHPLMREFDAEARACRRDSKYLKSKNLSVSFREQVEIFGDSDSEKYESSNEAMETTMTSSAQVPVTPARLRRIENGQVVDDIELDRSLFIQPHIASASTPFASPSRKKSEKKSYSPLKDDSTTSPRKEQLRLADGKLPPNALRLVDIDDLDEDDDDDAEYIVPIEIPQSKVNITTVAEVHFKPAHSAELEEPEPDADADGNEKQDAENKAAKQEEAAVDEPNDDAPAKMEQSTNTNVEEIQEKNTVATPPPADEAADVSFTNNEESVPHVVGDVPAAAECVDAGNSSSSFASAEEGQPDLGNMQEIEQILSFIDGKDIDEDGVDEKAAEGKSLTTKASADTADNEIAAMAAKFSSITASPRPSLHAVKQMLEEAENGGFETASAVVEAGSSEEPIAPKEQRVETENSETLGAALSTETDGMHLFVDDDSNLPLSLDDDKARDIQATLTTAEVALNPCDDIEERSSDTPPISTTATASSLLTID